MYMMIAMAVVSAVASVQESKNKARMYTTEANLHSINAQYAAQSAREELVVADQDAQTLRRQGRQRTAEQFASFAESGFDPSTGSAALSLAQSNTNIEMDAARARYQGEMKSRTRAVESQQEAYQAKISLANAKAAKSGGFLSAASSLLKGFSAYKG